MSRGQNPNNLIPTTGSFNDDPEHPKKPTIVNVNTFEEVMSQSASNKGIPKISNTQNLAIQLQQQQMQ